MASSPSMAASLWASPALSRARAPVAQQQRAAGDAVHVEEVLQQVVEVPGAVGDVEHRVVGLAVAAALEGLVEPGHALERQPGVGVVEQGQLGHLPQAGGVGVQHGVVEVADHRVLGVAGDQDLAGGVADPGRARAAPAAPARPAPRPAGRPAAGAGRGRPRSSPPGRSRPGPRRRARPGRPPAPPGPRRSRTGGTCCARCRPPSRPAGSGPARSSAAPARGAAAGSGCRSRGRPAARRAGVSAPADRVMAIR